MKKIMQNMGVNLPTNEINGNRVVTYKQIAELHQVPVKNLQFNFNYNQKHFIEGTDYFKITEPNPDTKNFRVSRLYFTESGYLMLVKSLTDDISWDVQRMLVNGYFRANLLDRVMSLLPIRTRELMRYRAMGLTQKEAGKLLGVSRDVIQKEEYKLKEIGYTVPRITNKPRYAGGTKLAKTEQMEICL